MIERRLLGVSRIVMSAAVLWALSHSYARAEDATADVPSMWTQGLGSAYLFGFGGGVVMFFVLMLMKMRDDKPTKEGAK